MNHGQQELMREDSYQLKCISWGLWDAPFQTVEEWRDIDFTNNRIYRRVQKNLWGRKPSGQDELWHDSQKGFKILIKLRRKSENTSEIRKGFCFVISITCFSNCDTEKDDDDNDNNEIRQFLNILKRIIKIIILHVCIFLADSYCYSFILSDFPFSVLNFMPFIDFIFQSFSFVFS